MNIYVTNFSPELEEAQLGKLFEVFGDVQSIKIIRDKDTGKSKGFGFVIMENSVSAERAINELHNIELAGKRLIVREANQKPNLDDSNNKVQASSINSYYPKDREENISFKIPKEIIEAPVKYSKTLSEDGFVRLKFNS